MRSPYSFYRRPFLINGKFFPVNIVLRADMESEAKFRSASQEQVSVRIKHLGK